MSLKFVFPELSKTTAVPKYASFVNGNVPTFRVHGGLGFAKASFYNRNGFYGTSGKASHDGAILELVDGEWFVLHSVTKGTEYNDLPWVKKIVTHSSRRNPAFVSYSQTPDQRAWLYDEHVRYEAKPMTSEEYAEWRIAVDREIRGGSV